MIPFSPPRRFFVDGAHYAAWLSMLDGIDRINASLACPDARGKVQFAEAATDSFSNAREYLKRSSIWRFAPRPDYDDDVILKRVGQGELHAEMIRKSLPLPPLCREVDFALTLQPAPRFEVNVHV